MLLWGRLALLLLLSCLTLLRGRLALLLLLNCLALLLLLLSRLTLLLLLSSLTLLLSRLALLLMLNCLALLQLRRRLIAFLHIRWGSHIAICRERLADGRIGRASMIDVRKLSPVGAGLTLIL